MIEGFASESEMVPFYTKNLRVWVHQLFFFYRARCLISFFEAGAFAFFSAATEGKLSTLIAALPSASFGFVGSEINNDTVQNTKH